MLIYDIEIEKAIPNKSEPLIEGIEYCKGWGDHANMGISVIGCYDYVEDRYRAFLSDNMGDFFALCAARTVRVGFNNINFDDKVIASLGQTFAGEPYDIMRELMTGLGTNSFAGLGLDACCKANFGAEKSGSGAMAPVLWQRGQHGAVIDYCFNDVRLTKQLLDTIIGAGGIIDPRPGRQDSFVHMRKPGEARPAK